MPLARYMYSFSTLDPGSLITAQHSALPSKTQVLMGFSSDAGAGLASVVWPGGGTLIGYNVADIAISILIVGPFTEKYISMEPPPAALDAGQLEGDPPMHGPQAINRATGEVTELDGSDDLSDAESTVGKSHL